MHLRETGILQQEILTAIYAWTERDCSSDSKHQNASNYMASFPRKGIDTQHFGVSSFKSWSK